MSDSSLIFAKELDGHGGAVPHTDIDVIQSLKQPLWVHFDGKQSATSAVIQKAFPDIDEHTLQAILDQDARPRTLQLEAGVLLILRAVNHNEGDDPEDMVAVRLWITDTRIISLRFRKSKAVMQVSESLDQHRGPKTIGDVVVLICSTILGFIETSIDALDEQMYELESRVLDNPDRQLRIEISELRKKAILFRRYIAPQREAINQLRNIEVNWLSPQGARRIQEAQDTLIRGVEDLDAIRERSQVVKDELVNALSDRLNRNLYVLSVVTAVFLPLGFLTGLFGINIGGMPGVDNEHAFMFFVSCLSAIVLVQVVLFRLFKWF